MLHSRYSDHVAELYFLQIGGNMMDFPSWRKKPPTPQYMIFTKSYPLDGNIFEEQSKNVSELPFSI